MLTHLHWTYSGAMAETHRCIHCGAVYEVTREDAPVREEHAADCQVCGKALDAQGGSSNARYELVRMPDGTNV